MRVQFSKTLCAVLKNGLYNRGNTLSDVIWGIPLQGYNFDIMTYHDAKHGREHFWGPAWVHIVYMPTACHTTILSCAADMRVCAHA